MILFIIKQTVVLNHLMPQNSFYIIFKSNKVYRCFNFLKNQLPFRRIADLKKWGELFSLKCPEAYFKKTKHLMLSPEAWVL